jgi:hypothetical protein
MQIRVYENRTTYEPHVEDDEVLHEEGEGHVSGTETDAITTAGNINYCHCTHLLCMLGDVPPCVQAVCQSRHAIQPMEFSVSTIPCTCV